MGSPTDGAASGVGEALDARSQRRQEPVEVDETEEQHDEKRRRCDEIGQPTPDETTEEHPGRSDRRSGAAPQQRRPSFLEIPPQRGFESVLIDADRGVLLDGKLFDGGAWFTEDVIQLLFGQLRKDDLRRRDELRSHNDS